MTKFFATLALAVSVFTVSAQESAKTAPAATQTVSVNEKVATNTRKIGSKLGLNPTQQRQLTPFLTDFYTTKEKLAAIKTTNASEYKAGMKTAADNLVRNIKSILTESQKATFDQLAGQLTAE